MTPWGVFSAVLALGGEPQCAPALTACYYSFDPQFGDAFDTLRAAPPPYNASFAEGAAKDAVCSRANWVRRELCVEHCPLRLEITDPPHLRMGICIQDSAFLPYKPLAHVDLYHPLNGQVMQIAPVGGPGASRARRHGCRVEDYDGIYGGKIALFERGGCFFDQKMKMAAVRDATAALVVNSDPVNALEEQLFTMTGNSDLVPPYFPSGMIPRHHGGVLFDALSAGEKVFGKIVFDCSPLPSLESMFFSAPRISPLPWDATDTCPSPKLADICNGAAADEDRLCAKCPIVLTEGASGADVCLHGNWLLPRKAENKIDLAWTLPYQLAPDEAVWVLSLPGGGCAVGDFDGLGGKAVFLKVGRACLPYEAARRAAAAGVAALVVVPVGAAELPVLLHGPSQFLGIPVHSLGAEDAAVLEAQVLIHNAVYKGLGYLLPPGAVLAEGSLPPRPTTPAPRAITVATPTVAVERPVFEMNAMVALYVVCLAVGTAVVARTYLRQQARAIVLPEVAHLSDSDDGDDDATTTGPTPPLARRRSSYGVDSTAGSRSRRARGQSIMTRLLKKVPFTVPMSAAMMAVTLVCMATVGMVTYWWAFTDGQLATDDAQRHSEDAQNNAYAVSVDTVDGLLTSLHMTVAGRVGRGVAQTLAMGEQQLAAAAAVFTLFDGTWASFDAAYDAFVNVAERAQASGWVVNTFTAQGFFVNPYLVTDARDDIYRNDGVNGSVAATNDGFLYGTNRMAYNPKAFQNEYFTSYPKELWNVHRMYGGYFGDPLAATDGLPPGAVTWHASKFSFPQAESRVPQPLSVFAPLYNGYGAYMGTVEVRTWWGTLRDVLKAVVAEDESFAKATVVLLDRADGVVLAHNGDVYRHKVEAMVHYAGSWREMLGAYTLDTLPPVHVRAYANYMRGKGATNGTGSGLLWPIHPPAAFNQAAHYTPNAVTAVEVAVQNGVATDVSGDYTSVTVADGLVTVDGEAEEGGVPPQEVIQFAAETRVFLGRHLSPRSPRVLATRVHVPGGAWVSAVEVYDRVDRLSAAETCIALADPAAGGAAKCVLKEPLLAQSCSITVKVKPFRAIADVLPTAATPVLFTDAELGDSDIRFFGNGQLYLNVLSYGCRTDAHPGGIPADAWTTLTATIDYERSECSVYVNGTLSSREGLSKRYAPKVADTPYIIGVKLEGLLERLVIHNISLSDTEIASIHQTGRLVRDVPERVWTAALQPVLFEAPPRTGTGATRVTGGADPPAGFMDGGGDAASVRPSWGVAVLLPRDYVMGHVEENHRVLLSNLAVNAENVQKELRQKQGETIMAMLVIALAAILALAVFSNHLSQPYALAALMMTDASLLKFDADYIGAIKDREFSRIAEVRAWHVAAMVFLKSWTEHRKFLPDTLILDDAPPDAPHPSGTADKPSPAMSYDDTLKNAHDPRQAGAIQFHTARIGDECMSPASGENPVKHFQHSQQGLGGRSGGGDASMSDASLDSLLDARLGPLEWRQRQCRQGPPAAAPSPVTPDDRAAIAAFTFGEPSKPLGLEAHDKTEMVTPSEGESECHSMTSASAASSTTAKKRRKKKGRTVSITPQLDGGGMVDGGPSGAPRRRRSSRKKRRRSSSRKLSHGSRVPQADAPARETARWGQSRFADMAKEEAEDAGVIAVAGPRRRNPAFRGGQHTPQSEEEEEAAPHPCIADLVVQDMTPRVLPSDLADVLNEQIDSESDSDAEAQRAGMHTPPPAPDGFGEGESPPVALPLDLKVDLDAPPRDDRRSEAFAFPQADGDAGRSPASEKGSVRSGVSTATKAAGVKWMQRAGKVSVDLDAEGIQRELEAEREAKAKAVRGSVAPTTRLGKVVRLAAHTQTTAERRPSVAFAEQAASNSVRAVARRMAFKVSTAFPKKHIGMMVVGFKDWHSLIDGGAAPNLKLHAQLVTYVLKCFDGHGGVCDGFSGDRFAASFGAVRRCPEHAQKMCAAALALRYSLEADAQTADLRAHSALCAGGARIGTLGTSQMKRVSILSSLVPWGHALLRYAQHYDVPVAADKLVYQDASDDYHVRILGDVLFTKHRDLPLRLAEITGSQQALWAGATDEHAKWNQFVMAVVLNEWAAADAFHAGADEPGAPSKLLEELNAARVQRAFVPTELVYH
eukprot:TRINITY_DN17906_c0_g1_i1.p1 TRINITY_DN17906_c0_g1~~TRINITY_DN17906_c0_g1_i1.p1  ORF type:complete len:2127 (+),score=634.92 TRINITY_DN17906_c0_g1_i1:51-6431(+)